VGQALQQDAEADRVDGDLSGVILDTVQASVVGKDVHASAELANERLRVGK
jgi:hypothetical protein